MTLLGIISLTGGGICRERTDIFLIILGKIGRCKKEMEKEGRFL